ncbi:hypothetical protein JCM3765_007607 [Sporobolomyces pararoseus]
MSHQNLTPRLPYEIIGQIFEEPGFWFRDVVKLCLVSRQLLEPAQKRLYRVAKILLVEERAQSANSPYCRTQYIPTTWKLFRTLSENPRLAKLVKELNLHLIIELFFDDRHKIGLETSRVFAVSTFLRLAENVEQVSFTWGWNRNLEELKVIKHYKKIKKLEFKDGTDEEIDFVAQNIPHLKQLKIWELHDVQFDPDEFSSPEKLEVLDIGQGSVEIMIAIVSANVSTLRYLKVPIEATLDLDFSQMSNLVSLHLTANRSEEMDEEEYKSKGRKFWKSLCKSTSLRTLTFSPGKCLEALEEALFGSSRYVYSLHDKPGPQQPISTLSTLRFDSNIDLERANLLLSGPLGSTLHQVVVPEKLGYSRASLEESNKIDFVAGVCQKRGIELSRENW